MAEKKKKSGDRKTAKNSKAFHDYFVEDSYEAGIELAGTEVKSIRMGNVNLKDAFCTIKDGQMTLNGMHVSPYEKGNIFNREPRRPRRLLMHKREIQRLFAKIKQDGYTLVPLQRPQGEGGGRPVQGQKALRQAGRRSQERRKAGDGPGAEAAAAVKLPSQNRKS